MKKHKTLDSHLGYCLRIISNRVSTSFERKLANDGVGIGEWVILNLLSEEKILTPAEIAKKIGITRGAASKLLEKLYCKELISRNEVRQDRRYQKITLTHAGEILLQKLTKHAEENEEEFFGHLSEESKDEVIKLLKEIVFNKNWDEIPIN